MIFISEGSKPIVKEAEIYASKLLSMKSHLQDLISKKARIDFEIKILTKSIEGKRKSYESNLKAKLSIRKESGILFPEDLNELKGSDPELWFTLKKLDDIEVDLLQLFEENQLT